MSPSAARVVAKRREPRLLDVPPLKLAECRRSARSARVVAALPPAPAVVLFHGRKEGGGSERLVATMRCSACSQRYWVMLVTKRRQNA